MNCRQGDLALVSYPDSEPGALDNGKVVQVVEAGEDWSHVGDSRYHWACDTLGQRVWLDNQSGFSDGVELIDFPDSCLRPLRGGEGQDEVLRIAGLPRELEKV